MSAYEEIVHSDAVGPGDLAADDGAGANVNYHSAESYLSLDPDIPATSEDAKRLWGRVAVAYAKHIGTARPRSPPTGRMSPKEATPRLVRFLEDAVKTLAALQSFWKDFDKAETHVMLELLQTWLDVSEPSHDSRRSVVYLLLRLSASSKQLPASLYVHDVHIGHVRDPARTGGFADIFMAEHKGKFVALKRLRTHSIGDSEYHKNLIREALVWRQLKHPFILPFIGIDKDTFAATGFLCLVSPWMQRGTLKQYVESGEYQPLRDRHRVLRETAEGMEYLHSQKVVHGDIKDVNILITDRCHVQLCDFGLVVVGDITDGCMTTTAQGLGTGIWMSPERLLPDKHRRTKADDVYAFACLCYYMYAGHPPFHDMNQMAACFQINQGRRPPKPKIDALSPQMWSLVERCWSQAPQDRPMITAALRDLRAMETRRRVLLPKNPKAWHDGPSPAVTASSATAASNRSSTLTTPDLDVVCDRQASLLWARFLRTPQRLASSLYALEGAVEAGRTALGLRPPTHRDRARTCRYLAMMLRALFEETGEAAALLEATALQREAGGLLAPTDPARGRSCFNLAVALWRCFQETGGGPDGLCYLEEAIALQNEVLEILPAKHADRACAKDYLEILVQTRTSLERMQLHRD